MKRTSLWFTALAVALLGVPRDSVSQVTVQASNGWSFTFTGNVNAFWVFESQSENAGGITDPAGVALVGDADRQGSAIRTGLLPTFASFEAKGHEMGVDLMVHFGFAPQIQTPRGHDNFGFGTQAGAQIDMRQVYLKVSGEWGSILAGRELGVFGRQNILNDQTLFGTGATGGNFDDPAGTTLGRIGFGYIYPNFDAQIAYTSPDGRPAQITIALFDPANNNGFNEIVVPRVESEFTYSYEGFTGWVNGVVQIAQKDLVLDETATPWGVGGGLKYATETFSVVGSGYYGQGVGTTLLFLGGRSSVPGSVELRKSFGGIGQFTVTPPGSKVTFGGSFGQSTLQNADDEADFKVHNRSITGGIYYQATNALKVVGEGTYAWADDDDDATADPNKTFVISAGLMLFF